MCVQEEASPGKGQHYLPEVLFIDFFSHSWDGMSF
jgi:hypothetical protein